MRSKRKAAVLVILASLLAAGALLRLQNLVNPSLWIDEGYSINAGQVILEHGYPKLDSGRLYSSSPLNTYLIAGSISIFGLDPYSPWSARFPSVIFGIGVIFLTYLLSRRVFGNELFALTAVAILAFSLWEIEWSRQARGYTELQFFFLLTLIALWDWLKKPRWRSLILTLGSSGAAFLSHPLGVIVLPVIPIALGVNRILYRKERLPLRQSLTLLVLSLGGGLVLFLARLPNLQLYDFVPFYSHFLWDNLRLLTVGSIVGILLGWFDKKRFWLTTFLSIALLFPLLLIVSYTPLVQMRYLFPLLPVAVIFSLYAVWRVVELLPLKSYKLAKSSFFLLAAILIFSSYLTLTPKPVYYLEPDTPRPNFKETYNIINNTKKAGDIIISPYAHLTNIYLGEKGYWLPISLSGKKSDLEQKIIDGQYDYYVGAPIVKDEEHLRQLLEEKNGFIVIDGMATARLKEMLPLIITHPNVQEIYTSGERGLDRVWLYRF